MSDMPERLTIGSKFFIDENGHMSWPVTYNGTEYVRADLVLMKPHDLNDTYDKQMRDRIETLEADNIKLENLSSDCESKRAEAVRRLRQAEKELSEYEESHSALFALFEENERLRKSQVTTCVSGVPQTTGYVPDMNLPGELAGRSVEYCRGYEEGRADACRFRYDNESGKWVHMDGTPLPKWEPSITPDVSWSDCPNRVIHHMTNGENGHDAFCTCAACVTPERLAADAAAEERMNGAVRMDRVERTLGTLIAWAYPHTLRRDEIDKLLAMLAGLEQ